MIDWFVAARDSELTELSCVEEVLREEELCQEFSELDRIESSTWAVVAESHDLAVD